MALRDRENELLWRNISELPYFRGLLRAVEAGFYEHVDLKQPILDLGCGDGHFASVALPGIPMVGMDPERKPLKETLRRGVYQKLVQAAGDGIPFPNEYFSTIISNSVLEHILDLEPVIKEVSRTLKKGGSFIFCVPNDNFLKALSVSNIFDKIHMKWLGNAYRSFFNRISRHKHCDPFELWEKRLLRSGLIVSDHWDYFSEKALHTLEWGHYFGLPSLICKKLTGKWILVPKRWNFFFTNPIVQRGFKAGGVQRDGVYSFYIAIKLT